MNDLIHLSRAHRWALFLALVAVLATGGCTSPAKFRPATGGENFPPYEGKVRVLENLPPSDRFKRVGVVIVEGVNLTKDATMVAAIKKEAAARGADAVVIQGPAKLTKDSSGGVQKTLAAWAIRLNR